MRPGIAVAGTRHALAKRGQPYANPSQCSFVPAGIRGTTADFARRYEAQKYFLRGQSGNYVWCKHIDVCGLLALTESDKMKFEDLVENGQTGA